MSEHEADAKARQLLGLVRWYLNRYAEDAQMTVQELIEDLAMSLGEEVPA